MGNPIMERKQRIIESHFLAPFTELLSIRAHIRINENDLQDLRQARNYFYDTADQIPTVLACTNPHCLEGQFDLKTRILKAISQQQVSIREKFICQSQLNPEAETSEACLYLCEYTVRLNYQRA